MMAACVVRKLPTGGQIFMMSDEVVTQACAT